MHNFLANLPIDQYGVAKSIQLSNETNDPKI